MISFIQLILFCGITNGYEWNQLKKNNKQFVQKELEVKLTNAVYTANILLIY